MPKGIYNRYKIKGKMPKNLEQILGWNKGKRHSEESKRKMSISHKGAVAWNKGKIGVFSKKSRKKMSLSHLGKKRSEETKRKIGESHKGKKLSKEHRKILSLAHMGKKISEETRKKIGETKKGEKNHNWKGGITPIHQKIRASLEYRLWRKSVFKRDNFTCIWCGYKSKGTKPADIHADHIKPFALFPELRFAIDNGRTLCIPCHRKTDTWGNKSNIQ